MNIVKLIHTKIYKIYLDFEFGRLGCVARNVICRLSTTESSPNALGKTLD